MSGVNSIVSVLESSIKETEKYLTPVLKKILVQKGWDSRVAEQVTVKWTERDGFSPVFPSSMESEVLEQEYGSTSASPKPGIRWFKQRLELLADDFITKNASSKLRGLL